MAWYLFDFLPIHLKVFTLSHSYLIRLFYLYFYLFLLFCFQFPTICVFSKSKLLFISHSLFLFLSFSCLALSFFCLLFFFPRCPPYQECQVTRNKHKQTKQKNIGKKQISIIPLHCFFALFIRKIRINKNCCLVIVTYFYCVCFNIKLFVCYKQLTRFRFIS